MPRLIFLAFVLVQMGCAGGPETLSFPTRSGPPVPLETVSDAYEAARRQDSSLMLGFFTAPWIDDHALDKPTSVASAEASSAPLIDALQAEVAPGTWTATGRRAFREGQWLVVFHTKEVLKQITPWMEQYSRDIADQRGVVSTQLTILSTATPDDVLADAIGKSKLEPLTDSIPIEPAQAETLISHAGVTRITAPRISLYDGQRGTVAVYTRSAYVQDYQIYYVDEDIIADPVIATINDGVAAEIRSVRHAEDIEVELDVSFSDLQGIQDQRVDVEGRELTIQLPDIAQGDTRARFRQAAGRTMLIRGPVLRGQQILLLATSE